MNSIQSLRLILILSIASLATGLTLAQTASTSSRYTASPASPDGIGKRYMDREISGVMGWQGAPWLERQEREREERTDLLLKALALKPGMVVADIGAGTGYLTRRMAPAVLPGGKILAVDVQPEMVPWRKDNSGRCATRDGADARKQYQKHRANTYRGKAQFSGRR